MTEASERTVAPRRRSWLQRSRGDLLPSAVFLVVCFLAQIRSGAYHSDFSQGPDEPTHAVSCLLAHDFLAHPSLRHPLRFAWNFYAHYPKVAIGHWPPLFYLCEGAWTLLFGRSRGALLAFVALCGAALLASLYTQLRRYTGVPLALAAAAALFCCPPFQEMVSAVRPDLLLAVLVFWAACFAARFFCGGDRANIVRAGVLGVAACLVHGRGALLMLVPFALAPLSGRSFTWRWAVAGVGVALLFLLPPHFQQANHLSFAAVFGTLFDLFRYGWFALPLLISGAVLALRRSEGREFQAAMIALLAAFVVFTALTPVHWDDYRVVVALPAVLSLIAANVRWLQERRQAREPRAARRFSVSLAALACVGFAAGLAFFPRKPDTGYRSAIAGGLLRGDAVALIAGDALHEGSFIAEAALADPGLRGTVLRSSKALAVTDWDGHTYALRYPSAQQLNRFLDEQRVTLVVVQADERSRAYVNGLREALRGNAGWTSSAAPGMELYRRSCSGRAPDSAQPCRP